MKGPHTMNNETSNVTPIESKQPQPTCRFTISATLRGFPIVIEGEGRAGDLKLIVERLLAAGAEPPQAAKPSNAAGATAEDAPVCEYHGAMKRGNYGWFCPKKMGDGSYCKATA
jgi:hypothetical protein